MLRPQKHYFKRHFRASEMALTKTRLLKHDFSVHGFFEQCQVVVFIADDLGFLGPGSPDLMTELCPPQDTA